MVVELWDGIWVQVQVVLQVGCIVKVGVKVKKEWDFRVLVQVVLQVWIQIKEWIFHHKSSK